MVKMSTVIGNFAAIFFGFPGNIPDKILQGRQKWEETPSFFQGLPPSAFFEGCSLFFLCAKIKAVPKEPPRLSAAGGKNEKARKETKRDPHGGIRERSFFMKRRQKITAAALIAAAVVSPVSVVAGEERSTYPTVPVFADGATLRAVLDGDTSTVPVRAFYEAYGISDVTWNAKTRTATVRGAGLEVSVTDGSHILWANGRCLYSPVPYRVLEDGRLYAPVRVLAKTLSLSVFWDGEARTVSLAGKPRPLASASEYYNKDELYWLSRIISAESRGEPLLGQIAVGNVILNRVESSQFPSTVWGVIFDRKNGVQFSPVANGSVYAAPADISVVAAKICLEGESLSRDILYFCAPKKAPGCWVIRNRPEAFSIGNHTFYY